MRKKLGFLRFGEVEFGILEWLKRELKTILNEVFENFQIIEEIKDIPNNSYNKLRKQYLSPLFLHETRSYAEDHHYDVILGITAVDLFVHELNFVFGQAEYGPAARAAVIALYRLYPEFYRQRQNKKLFLARVVKEGLHEIGHTLRLEHCRNMCIMIFSNNIVDTDMKPAAFCQNCYEKILKSI